MDALAVFFDAVGTLIEPCPPAIDVYLTVGRLHGVNLSRETIALRFHAAFQAQEEFDQRNGYAVDEERELNRWKSIVAAVFGKVGTLDLFEVLWTHFAQPSAWHVAEDVARVLRELDRLGLTLGIGSNFDCRLNAIIDGLSQLAPLRHRLISSEVGWRKPSPHFFQAVIRAAGCTPDRIVFVGDRRDVDYDGASAAGLLAVLLDASSAATRSIKRLEDLFQFV